MRQPDVFISYAWQGESEKIAVEIEQEFCGRGMKIIRDKTFLEYTGRIKEFMEKIGQGQYIILVISDRYLKSKNCLFELLQIYKAGNFRERIFPLFIEDTRIAETEDQLAYVHYWEKKKKNLEAEIKKGDLADLHNIYEDLDLYADIRRNLDRLTAILKDINSLTIEMHRQKGYDYLYQAIMKRYRRDNGIKQIKILALTAAPEDGQDLRYEMEQDILLESFKNFDRGEVFLDMPDPVNSTLQEMAERLVEDRHDILLISAHGGMNDKGEGILCLEGDWGQEVEVPGQELAGVLNAGEGVGAYCNTPLQEPPLSDAARGEVLTSPPDPLSDTERGGVSPSTATSSGAQQRIPGTGMLNRIAESPQFVKPQAKLSTVLAGSEGRAEEPCASSGSNCSLCLNFAEAICESPATDRLTLFPRIVILSACHTAREGQNLVPVAQVLFKAGINTVIGMKEAITHNAAIVFNVNFFNSLNDNRTVKEAFEAGKQAIEIYEREQVQKNPQYKYRNEAQIPHLLCRDENLTRKNFNDHVIEAPPPPQSHQFLGAQYRERGFIGRRRVLRQLYRQIEEKTGAIVLKGPGGIGKSTLTTRLAGQLTRKGYDFIVIQGQTSEAAILQALGKKGKELAIKEAEAVAQAEAEAKDKLNWFLEHLLFKHRLLVIFDNFESNQSEKEAGEFGSESLKAFLHYFKECLEGHESLLLFSSRYRIPGLEGPDIGEFSASEFRKMVFNGKALGQLDGKAIGQLQEKIGGSPRAIELLDTIARQEFGTREITWQMLARLFPELEQRLLEEHHKDDFFAPLFLDKLLGYLEEGERQVLDRLAIFRVPVAEAGIVALGGAVTRPDRQRLTDLSLVEYRADDGLYYCHRLTAGYVLGKLDYDIKNNYHRAAAVYWDSIVNEKGEYFLGHQIEARQHYLQAGAWDQAAEITFSLEQYLTLHGFPYQSFDLLQEIADKPLSEWNRANTHHLFGTLFQAFGKYEEALENYLKARDLMEKLGDEKSFSNALHQVGIIYQEKGDYEAALDQYQKSLEIKEKIGDIKGVAISLHQVGMIYQKKGDYEAALDQYKKSLEIAEKIGDIKGVAGCLHQVGMIYEARGDYDAALDQYRKSLEIAEQIGYIKGVALSLGQIGNVYLSKGDYDTAIEQYRKALQTFEEINDINSQAACLHQVGIIYHKKGDYEAALGQYQKSLEIREQIGDISGVAKSLHQVGIIYEERGDYDAALAQYRKSLAIKEKIGDVPGMASSWAQIGAIYFAREDYPSALGLYLQSLAVFQKIGSPNAQLVAENIALIRNKLGDAGFEALLASTQTGMGEEKKD